MKYVLFELASSYKIMNPLRGLFPGLPIKLWWCLESTIDLIDSDLVVSQSDWQKEAMEYVSIRIKPSTRYKLKKFMEDEKLNKIRFDKSLNYFQNIW